MKTRLLIVAIAVSLVACGEPIPQHGWVQNSVDMKQVPGLEDCKYFSVRPSTGTSSIHVIRCPLSAVSAQWMAGKTSTGSVTIDENRIRELEQQYNHVSAELAKAEAELNTAKAGK